MNGATPAKHSLGIFELDRGRVALPIELLCEVIHRPPKLTAPPRAAPFVLGMLSLRGQLLPVVDLAGLLDIASKEASGTDILAIVEWREQRFALRMSAVGDIVEPALQSLNAGNALTPAAFSDPQSGEPVYLLDFDALMALEGMQAVQTQAGCGHVPSSSSTGRLSARALIVRCGDLQLALPSAMVDEIQPLAEIAPPVVNARGLVGTVTLRGRQLALFSPRPLLCQKPPRQDDNIMMVVVTIDRQPLAMAVESVVRMVDYDTGAVLALPDRQESCTSIIAGLLPHAELGESLLLDAQQLAEEQDLLSLAALYARAYQERQQESSQWRRFAFVHFEAEGQFVTPLEQFNEVMAMPSHYTPVTHSDPAWRGVVSHRERLLTLIDLRQLLGHPGGRPAQEVLVVESGSTLIGFMVEQTRRIEYIHAPADSLIIRWRGDQEPDALPVEQCKRLVILGHGSRKRVLSVLCLESLAALLTHDAEAVNCRLIDGQARSAAAMTDTNRE
ncbi:chemotaxis protein CheW [Kushneria aurantia]|uniref:Chemotaxis protein CheW n=1 Tax=Kushneria aurantia TaxID=504092 RepID=A0ABV6G160_9GAMM|nr:chemotaxis protein CheW [Kushneria aurantia]